MTDCCVCLTTDEGYLFPTVVSAIQARNNASASLADVAIFYFGAPSKKVDEFSIACMRYSVALRMVDPAIIAGGHTGYSRFFLDRFVPHDYTQLLYLDGDTQIASSLDPLISAQVAPATFLASPDPLAFKFDQISNAPAHIVNFFDRYASAHQLFSYFNSGVLRINRQGWDELAMKAYRFCRKLPPGQSVFPTQSFWDQDGLNVCLASARRCMSLKWNFPIFMRNARLEKLISPAVYHFMSEPKPWHGSFPPWNSSFATPYLQLEQEFPFLAKHRPTLTPSRRAKYVLQQRFKKALETVTWGLSSRRSRILAYEASTLV